MVVGSGGGGGGGGHGGPRYTEVYAALRVCERFGINPLEYDRLSPGWKSLLTAYEVVRCEDLNR